MTRPGAIGAALLLALAAAVAGQPPRFSRVVPVAGGWEVAVAAPAASGWRLAVDGRAWPSAPLAAAGEWSFLLPASAARLELVQGDEPLAALDLTPPSGRAAQFSSWTIYHVMLEMFDNGDAGNDGQIRGWRHPRYAGGDLAGVLRRVDYLRDLGVNTVWLSPLFQSNTSHGYDVENYWAVGDAVGVAGDRPASLALLRRLREALAKAGIRTLLDLPLNHASRRYDRKAGDPLALKPKATAAKQEAEKLWESWGAGYQYWNFDHPPTRDFLRAAALYWLRDERFDGLRLDYVRGVPHDFWSELHRAVVEAKPEAFLVGECWIDAGGPEANARDLASYYRAEPVGGAQFDSLLDFPLQAIAKEVFARGAPASDLELWLQRTAAIYGEGALPTYFLDNHDLARFGDWAGDRAKLQAAVGLLASLSSPIVLFYGTETALAGGEVKDGFTDSGRIPMPWEALDRDLVAAVAKALKARAQQPTLTHGIRLPLYADRSVWVQAKWTAGEVALVGVNLGREPRLLELPAAPLAKIEAWRALYGGAATPTLQGQKLLWTLPAGTSAVAGKRSAAR